MMDNLDAFYLVLPSNSSVVYFPDNTICTIIHLPREIRLSGSWRVGLAEIHLPCTIMHINESEASYTFKLGDGKKRVGPENSEFYHFPHGVYESADQLAREINSVRDVQDHQVLVRTEYQKGYYTLKRTCDCREPHYTVFNEKIRRIFGFEDVVHRLTGTFATSNDGTTVHVGNRPACLARAIPDQLYVYTDICEPYTVGDTQAALLRIVSFENTKYKFGTNMVKQFAPIHYIPVLHHSFQNIVVDIRDQHGKKITFQYGTSTITLHFKRDR